MSLFKRLFLTVIVSSLSYAPLSYAGSFDAASQHIDLDGELVGYIDFEGDGQEIGTALNVIYQKVLAGSPQLPPIPLDFTMLFENLGFGSVKALALSSQDVEPGLHRNRSVMLLNGELQGLFALHNIEPLTFTAAEKAPVDATGAMTVSINTVAVSDTLSRVMQQIMGPMGAATIQQLLIQVLPGTEVSYRELLESLSGQWDGFWLQDYDANTGEIFKFWLRVEGAGKLLARVRAPAEAIGATFSDEEDGLSADFGALFDEAAKMGLFVQADTASGALLLYSHADWTDRSEGPRLTENEAFKSLAERLPREGIAFSYSVGTDMSPLLAGLSAIPQAAQYAPAAEALLDFLIGDFLKPNLSVTFMAEGALVSDQYAGYSAKQAILTLPAVAGGGVVAAMAIPAFQKVRETSQQKAVINNLRQLGSAADQYFLEEGKTSVRVEELVGPGKYIRTLNSVAGERYDGMVIESGQAISVTLGNGEVISLPY